MYQWSDHRTRIGSLLHQTLDEPIPGGVRYAYVKTVLYQLVRRPCRITLFPIFLQPMLRRKARRSPGKLNRLRMRPVLRARILPQQLLNQGHAQKCGRENEDRVEKTEVLADPIALTACDL
jgi:hypothetical protein